MSESFEKRLAETYGQLSKRLQDAADYVAKNPVDIATRSLRSVEGDTGLAPATFTRLARAMGYASFAELRTDLRGKITQDVNNFAARAERLQAEHGKGQQSFFSAHLSACIANIDQMAAQLDQEALAEAVDTLYRAKQVVVLGALGSTGLAEYLSYMAEYCVGNWRLANRMGSSIGATVGQLGKGDAMIVITKPPFSDTVLKAAQLVHEQGAYVIVLTDTYACPAMRYCSASFLVPTESPHFYSSYVASMALAETMIGMLVSRSGPEAKARIARIENINLQLGVVSEG